MVSQQFVVHDCWRNGIHCGPTAGPMEVALLIARLVVLGEISLMMDGSGPPGKEPDEPLTTPAKRRKLTILQKKSADPKTIQDARNLGKDVFSEMGPDGEEPLFKFL